MADKSIPFVKMAGAGNDFLVLEKVQKIPLKKLAVSLCDRTNGLGADGLLILAPSQKADFRMRILNADGSEAEMCGNGARCLAAYIARTKKTGKKSFSLETLAGIILAEVVAGEVKIRLSNPSGCRLNISLALEGRPLTVHFIDTGVPHAIVFVDRLADIPVNAIAPGIRYHRSFAPRGANVNFVEQVHSRLVAARTYERGVESETKACGTGSVAAALVTYLLSHPQGNDVSGAQMRVRTQSGEILEVTFDIAQGVPVNVWLKGSVRFIAEGQCFV